VIERWDESRSRLLDNAGGYLFAIVAEAIIGDDIGAVPTCGFELRLWGVGRHHDRAGGSDVSRRDRGSLRVIARRVADESFPQLLLAQGEDEVGRASDLESPALLQVFALEKGVDA
jgi:hypothetical protein